MTQKIDLHTSKEGTAFDPIDPTKVGLQRNELICIDSVDLFASLKTPTAGLYPPVFGSETERFWFAKNLRASLARRTEEPMDLVDFVRVMLEHYAWIEGLTLGLGSDQIKEQVRDSINLCGQGLQRALDACVVVASIALKPKSH